MVRCGGVVFSHERTGMSSVHTWFLAISIQILPLQPQHIPRMLYAPSLPFEPRNVTEGDNMSPRWMTSTQAEDEVLRSHHRDDELTAMSHTRELRCHAEGRRM